MTSDSIEVGRAGGEGDTSHSGRSVHQPLFGSPADGLTAVYELVGGGADFMFWLLVDDEATVEGQGVIHGLEALSGESTVQFPGRGGTRESLEQKEKQAPPPDSKSLQNEQILSSLVTGLEVRQVLASIIEQGNPSAYRGVLDQDESVWELRFGSAVESREGQFRIVGIARDVTDEIQREEHLRETVYLYRRLIDMMPDAVSIIGSEGELRYVNAAGAHLVGAAEIEEVLGRSYWDFVHPDDTDDLRSKAGALREGKPLDVSEYRMLRMDGSVVPVELASVPIKYNGEPAVLGTGRDMSRQHRLQRELLLVKRAIESTDEPVAIFDPEGSPIFHNPAFVRTTGYTTDELRAQGGLQVLFEDADVADEAVRELRQGNPWKGDVELRTRSDKILRMALHGNVVQTGELQPVGIVCIFTDISDRHRIRKELIAAKEEAEEIARLRSAILTNLTHEVRTPLTVILGFTSMLRQGVRKKYMRFVDLIERSGRRLLLMLDAILDLAQLESGSLEIMPEPFNVVDVADGVVGTLQPLARDKGIELRLEAASRSVPARLDHRVLARILNNLLDNAIKFTGEGSVRVIVESEDDWVKIRIKDTGVGIDETFLPRIFDEFTQESTGLERTHQGSGLGLAVSERLVKHMGGSIAVESEKNVGTTFTLRLPSNMEDSER